MAQCDGTYGPHQTLVEQPSINPYRFGALSAYSIIDSPDAHERNGIVYKALACSSVVVPWVDNCDGDLVEPKEPTDLSFYTEAAGCPQHLLTVFSCKTTTLDAMFSEARAAFDLWEQKATEDLVWASVITPGATDITPTPGIGLSLVQALALLESTANGAYPGQLTIHGDRGLGNYAAFFLQLVREGAALYTPLGSKWALYADGLNTDPDGDPAPAGFAWLYATSNVSLRRWPTEVYPDGVERVLLPNSNEPRVVVERTIVPSIECIKFGVLVDLSLGTGSLGVGDPVEP